MTPKYRRFPSVAALISDIILLNSLFLLFSSLETGVGMEPGYLLWVLCGLFTYLCNRLFLGKSRPLPAVFFLNFLLFAAQMVLFYFYGVNIGGFPAWFFAVSFLIYTTSRAYSLVVTPITAVKTLVYVECSFLGVLAFLSVQLGPTFTVSPLHNLVVFGAFILNLTALITTRIAGEKSRTLFMSKMQGVFSLGTVFLLIGALLSTFFLFLSQGVTAGLSRLFVFITQIVGAVFRFIWKALDYLLSLIPAPPNYDVTLPEPGFMPVPSEAAAEKPIAVEAWVIVAVLCVAAAAVVFLIAYLIFRFRKVRIGRSLGSEGREEPQSRIIRPVGIKRVFARLLFEIRFFIGRIVHRNTPPGILLMLQRRARLHRITRHPGETHRRYLSRLILSLHREQDEPLAALAARLADELDTYYFDPGRPKKGSRSSLTGADVSFLKKGLFRRDKFSLRK